MLQNPHICLALARARQDDLLRDARRHRLRTASGNDRPSALARLAALRHRGRPAKPAAAPAS
ncbi:MAG: hypothetical protein ACRDNI_03870 [Gaiellaceae bacterium]